MEFYYKKEEQNYHHNDNVYLRIEESDNIQKIILDIDTIFNEKKGSVHLDKINNQDLLAQVFEAIGNNENIVGVTAHYHQLQHENVKLLTDIQRLYLCDFEDVNLNFSTNIEYMVGIEDLRINVMKCKKYFPNDVLKLKNVKTLDYNGKINPAIFEAFPNMEKADFSYQYTTRLQPKPIIHDLSGIMYWKNLKSLQERAGMEMIFPPEFYKLVSLEHLIVYKFILQSKLPSMLENGNLHQGILNYISKNIEFLNEGIAWDITVNGLEFMEYHEALLKLKNINSLEFRDFEGVTQAEILPIISKLNITKYSFNDLHKDNSLFQNVEYLSKIEELELGASNSVGNWDSIAVLQNLTSLKVHFTDEAAPMEWNQLQRLEKLRLSTYEKVDIAQLGHFSNLKKIELEGRINNTELFLSKNPQIIELLFFYTHKIEGKPLSGLNQLQALENLTISLELFEDYIDEIDFTKLTKLKSIRVFSNHHGEISEISNKAVLKMIDDFMQMPLLENVSINVKAIPNLKIANWNHLKIFSGCSNALEIIVIPNEVQTPYGVDENIFKQIRATDLTPTQKVILWGLKNNRIFDIEKYITAQWDIEPAKSQIFIAGKPLGMTKTELEKGLKSKGFNVVNKFSDKVTHVLLGDFIVYETALELVKSNKKLLSSNKAVTFLNSPEDFYLLQEENTALNEQVINLLLSQEEGSLILALELIEAGGVTNSIITFLLIHSKLHEDVDLRKKARLLFKRFASEEVKDWVKSKYSSVSSEHDTELYENIFKHSDLSLSDAILCFQQYRNKNILKRKANPNVYETGLPYIIMVNENTMKCLHEIDEKIELIEAKGFYCSFVKNSSFKPILDLVEKFSKLSEFIKLEYCDINKEEYELLQQKFKQVKTKEITIL